MRHFRGSVSTTLLALLAIPAALASGVDPALLALVPPGTQTLAGIDQTEAQSTPIGQALWRQIQPDPAAAKAMAAAGFDPRRDLRQIVSSFGSGPNASGVLLLGRGSFHPDKIASAALASGATVSTYRGIQLIQPQGPNKSNAASASVAILDSTTLLAGDPSSVKAAIDRHASGVVFSGAVAGLARQIAAQNDAWIATLAPQPGSAAAASLGAQLGPLANLLQAALQLSAGLKFQPNQVTLSADVLTRTPQDAQAMVDILKFGIQMLESNSPQGNPSPQPPEGAASLASRAQISAAGSTLHAVLSIPEQELEQMFLSPPPSQPRKIARR